MISEERYDYAKKLKNAIQDLQKVLVLFYFKAETLTLASQSKLFFLAV